MYNQHSHVTKAALDIFGFHTCCSRKVCKCIKTVKPAEAHTIPSSPVPSCSCSSLAAAKVRENWSEATADLESVLHLSADGDRDCLVYIQP